MAINYNELITFGQSGTAKDLNCVGLDFSEEGNQSWTNGPFVEMDIQLPFVRQDVIFQLQATPFIVPEAVSIQKVFIFLGGLFIGYSHFTNHDVKEFRVNRSVVSARSMRLSMIIPTAVSPASLSLSEDMRELGIYLTSIVFRTAI